MRFAPLAAMCCAILTELHGTAQAQQRPAPDDGSPHGVAGVGGGVVPEYDGSGDVRVIPFATADIRWGGVGIQLRGAGLRLDVVSDPRLSLGPVVGPRLPRNDVEGPVGLLPEIGTAIEAGGFVSYRLGGDATGQGSLRLELSVVHDVTGTHDGLLATANATYAAVQQRDMFVAFGVQTSWADADYTRTYFGIDAAGAAASGLAAYRPGSGFRDIGAGLTAGYWFSERFGVVGRAGANYLIGDTADSPIVDQGSRWQPGAGLMLAYRF